MCIPKEKRSLRGHKHDEIYEYFDGNSLCDYALDEDLLQWMKKQDGSLRDNLEKNFIGIVTVVEEFAIAKNWREKLSLHAVGGFLKLMENHGCLDGVPGYKVLLTVFAHLYFYIGILSLDRAAMIGKL